MKLALWISAACAITLGFTSCGTSGGGGGGSTAQQPGIGPYDSRGNYHEEWADNPALWRRPGGGSSSSRVTKTEDVPSIAQNEQPPLNSVPLASAPAKPSISETKVTSSRPEAVVVKTRPLTKDEAERIRSKTKIKAESEPETVKSKPKAKPEPEVARSKSKTKATVKTKPKSSSRYVVKQGDSLSAIASRNGTSVSALQRENGISGTLIRPGQSISIPRK